jgi:hypothetical protein
MGMSCQSTDQLIMVQRRLKNLAFVLMLVFANGTARLWLQWQWIEATAPRSLCNKELFLFGWSYPCSEGKLNP